MLPLCSALIAAIALALALAATRAAGQTQPSNIAENTAGFSNARTGQSSGSNAKCITGNVDVDVGAQNSRSTLKAPDNNMALTQLIVEFTQVNSSVATTASAGPSNVNGTYSIYSEFCFPVDTAAQSKVQTLQILTHGGTLDNNYWDIASTNSYIEAAISAGYATFAYDRLGSGLSEHPDPVEVVQIPIQIELLHLIVQRFRDAKIGGRSFENVVGVGHSLGAALTQAVAAKYPRDFDALILQGISTSLQYAQTGVVSTGMQIANTDPSGRFSDLPSGYFSIAPVPQALQFAFYRYPNYRTESKLPPPFFFKKKKIKKKILPQSSQRPPSPF